MKLEEARKIVDGCEKLPKDRWDEAVALCIKDDEPEVKEDE